MKELHIFVIWESIVNILFMVETYLNSILSKRGITQSPSYKRGNNAIWRLTQSGDCIRVDIELFYLWPTMMILLLILFNF